MILNSTHRNMLISPARSIGGKVELYEGSTLLNTFNHTDVLKSFAINRAGDKKFFGFGICQGAEVILIDKERVFDINTSHNLKVSFITNKSTVSPTPRFYVSEVRRDENTNELTVFAYDLIYKTQKHTVSELNLEAPYTVMDVVSAIVGFLGISFSFETITRDAFNIEYPTGANFDGAETLREVLDAIAEATQTIYYINNSNALTFKHLKKDADPVLTIRKDDYFTLESKTNRRLSTIVSATELGDNVSASLAVSGTTQYVRDNPFWELREDIDTLLNNALTVIGGITINQFDCKWRGNYLVEPGDKIAIVTKDNNTVISYLLDEKYTYNGSLSANTSWHYEDNEGESVDNPSTLGDALKQTFAKVDKANKQIELVVSDVQGYNEKISRIEMTTDSITASVSQLDNNVSDLALEVNAKATPEDITISIERMMKQGVENVTTSTGFTFNEEGLHISKTNSEITTSITEDGMVIDKNNAEVLRADNEGVKAIDLHATTYLIIGKNSRFEDYNSNRTGCFWIGG